MISRNISEKKEKHAYSLHISLFLYND